MLKAMLDAAVSEGSLTADELTSYAAGAFTHVPTVATARETLEAKTGLKATTLRTYRPHWDRLVDRFGDRAVTDVRAVEIADLGIEVRDRAAYRDAGPAGHINDGSRAHIAFHNAARALWADAYRRLNLLPVTSPAHQNDVPRPTPNPNRRSLEDAELVAVFDTVETHSWDTRLHVLLLRTLLETGGRRTAIMTAPLRELDRSRSTLTVDTKNGQRRELLLAPATADAIVGLSHERGSEGGADPCFVNKSGTPANDATFDRMFSMVRRHLPAMHRLGLSAHHLRHTHGTRMERAASQAVAAASLGHTIPGVTGQYTKATEPEVVRAWSQVFQVEHPLLRSE